MQQPQEVRIETSPTGGVQIITPRADLPMRPLTNREMDAIRERRSDISSQLTRLMWRRARRKDTVRPSPENDARMERLEQAVDAIAIEIERVGESQRYQQKVLAEANMMPAMSSSRAPDPVRISDYSRDG